MGEIVKTFFVMAAVSITTFCGLHLINSQSVNDSIIKWGTQSDNVAPMPLVQDTNPLTAFTKTRAPQEQRGIEFRHFLAASVKISVSGASGSGTIVYYDESTGEAYVTSCGHLWKGTRSAEENKRRTTNCKVIVWYHNGNKLDSPKKYNAQVLFWSNKRGYDTSLLKFKPDWVPEYFPFAPLNHEIPIGSRRHSMGCDDGDEVAHYDVQIEGIRGSDLITKYNSPRPGRSGGGLLDDEGYYIGTCWGTSDYDGSGIGYFTPLSSIYEVYKRNGYDWLLGIDPLGLARRIPIRDWSRFPGEFTEDYIPIPGHNKIPLSVR